MTSRWHRICHRLCAWIYYERITVLYPERLIKEGPVLYVGLHRNGAVDGFIYHQAVPRGVFLISTQLRRHFFSRLFSLESGSQEAKTPKTAAGTTLQFNSAWTYLALVEH
jgi:1-acyl-sn-glycerol-3-phosphate acyltransferase